MGTRRGQSGGCGEHWGLGFLGAIREVQGGHRGCAYGVDLEEGEGDVCGSTSAGTRAAPTEGGRGMGRSTVAAGGQGHSALTLDAAGVVGEGALRGRSPRTREGRIGPTAQLQWSVVSGQWSERALRLAKAGAGTNCGLGATRRVGKFAPFLGCTRLEGVIDKTGRACQDAGISTELIDTAHRREAFLAV